MPGKRSAKKKVGKFLGRMVASSLDFQEAVSDITGPHHVLYPNSKKDVAAAINIAKKFKTFVRSGIQVAREDKIDGTGGVVINLMDLAKVAVKGNEVKAEPAATTEAIVEHLVAKGFALPLADDPLKSIVSNVLHERTSYLMRSLGPLSDYVSRISAVKPDGTLINLRPAKDVSCVAQCLADNAVVTEVSFKPAPAKNLWMFRQTCPYPGRVHFHNIVKTLFADANIGDRNDLVVEAYNGTHNIPIMRITSLGSTTKGKIKLKKLINTALDSIRDKYDDDIATESFSGSEVLEAIADAGIGTTLDPTIDSKRLHEVVAAEDDFTKFLSNHADDVHRGVAFGVNGVGKLRDDFYLTSRLQFDRDNGLVLTGHEHTPNSSFEESNASELKSAPLLTGEVVPPALIAPTSDIPGFRGEVYVKGDRRYKSRAKQYATSSFSVAKMSPFIVAYPLDKRDITIAIAFARENNKRIVARSGGHQYTGKSSGGNNTIVLSMEAFDQKSVNGNIAEVGPGIKLTSLARLFKKNRITIPHGECALVAIGGHAQTGGFGHLVRGFGLALDYVKSFDIVLANGTQRTINRPVPGVPATTQKEKLEKEIFWGVLGGNAGSFGIVTNYVFECVQDSNHPHSYGYSAVKKYSGDRFLNLMKEVQKWTRGVQNNTLAPGIDFMMTVESRGRAPFAPLLVEMVHSNLGGKNEQVDGDKVFRSIIRAASSSPRFWERFTVEKGPKSLSKLSDSFVRRWPATTMDGREFKYPYKKRINCTSSALSDTFVKEFAEKVDKVVTKTKGVNLVFQMLVGGGDYRNNKRRSDTSIPHRDYVFCFIFDLFYQPGYETKASQLQAEMQQLVDSHFSDGQEQRVFWGTFGDTNISKPTVRKMYYDNDIDYARLRKLKRKIDPNDVFHTELTVPLP